MNSKQLATLITKLLEEFKNERNKLMPKWEFDTFSPVTLLGIEQIATQK